MGEGRRMKVEGKRRGHPEPAFMRGAELKGKT
jgi:hypothetical protein